MSLIPTKSGATMRTIIPLLAMGILGAVANVSSAQNGRLFLDEAPLDHAVDIPTEKLAEYIAKMKKEEIGVVRMLEGGLYNVNIRRDENVTEENYKPEFHEDTIDVWVIQEGGGTLVTGGKLVDGKHVGGVERQIKVGDVIFIPAGIYHGVKNTKECTWLNIRFPEHRN
jgi:mannose-6-phosphate isomerase-like protein (cupin superfamily)